MIIRAPILSAWWLTIVLSPLLMLQTCVFVLHLSAPFAIAALVLGFTASQFVYVSLIRHTRRRVMQSLFRQRARSEGKPFVLISRSFGQSETFRVQVPLASGVAADLDLFGMLIFDSSYRHPIVVLGDKDLHPNDSANRALYMCPWPDSPPTKHFVFNAHKREVFAPPASWEEMFLRLAGKAGWVLLVPASTAGFLREVELLKHEQLGFKTIVYMWPAPGSHPNRALCAAAQAWEELRRPLAAVGLELPPHSAKGGMLRLGNDFKVQNHFPLPGKNILDPTVSAMRSDAPALADVVEDIESYEVWANLERYGPMWGGIAAIRPSNGSRRT